MSRENRKEFIIKVFYVITVAVSLFRFKVAGLESGLDNSWVYALNKFFHEGILWGHDVIFTYGPLGFILSPMNIGSNALISLAYWIIISVSAAIIFSYILFSDKLSVSSRPDNILLSFALFYLGSCVSGRPNVEYINTYMILCLLSLCRLSGKFKFFFMASLLCALSMFMKFNSGAIEAVILVMFVLLFKPVKYLPALLIAPALFFVCFMAYNPSLSELAYYIRGAYEISSGYISAMSVSFFKSMMRVKAFTLIAYSILLFVILSKSSFFNIKHSLKYAIIFAIPIFGVFRHAFIRADGHNFMFIPSLYIWLSLYVMFMNHEIYMKREFSKTLKMCLCVIFIASCILSATGFNKPGYWPGQTTYIMQNASTNLFFEVYDNISAFIKLPGDNRKIKISSEFVNTISQDTASVYPWEISYTQDIPNYKQMPVFQAYSAYTSWLDEQNAKFYTDNNAPKFIVLSMQAIGKRFPLIECPLTWFEIFRHYDIKLYDSDAKLFLLEHRESNSERRFKSHEIITKIYSHDEKIIIPETDNICIMNVNMNLNLMGKFMKTFYKIPAVLMTAEFADGRIITKRILPDTLKNDTIISSLLLNDNDFARFMNGDMNTGKVKSIQFKGDGIKYYSPEVSVTLSEAEL